MYKILTTLKLHHYYISIRCTANTIIYAAAHLQVEHSTMEYLVALSLRVDYYSPNNCTIVYTLYKCIYTYITYRLLYGIYIYSMYCILTTSLIFTRLHCPDYINNTSTIVPLDGGITSGTHNVTPNKPHHRFFFFVCTTNTPRYRFYSLHASFFSRECKVVM